MTQPTYSHSRIHPLYLFFAGMCMGAADVVPGVSGGTMAFVLGVYPQLLRAIESFNFDLLRKFAQRKWREAVDLVPWRFFLPLGLGIVVAVGSLAELLSYLLEHHQELLFSFFFGLIVASVVALIGRQDWSYRSVIALVIGTVASFWIVGLVPADPGHSTLILFGSGAVAICAMILPGISGSFILLILGQYKYCVNALIAVMDGVRAMDFAAVTTQVFQTILPIGLGAVIGLLAFTRVLSWLLARFYTLTVAVLIGFMIGSLRRIWPYKTILAWGEDRHGDPVPLEWENVLPPALDSSVVFAIVLCLIGFVLLSVIDHIYDRQNPVLRLLFRSK
jgi:putative membrane protein